nr:uncharacterized protein LOC128687218 [Cherax quadricarinatus]
MMDRHQLNPSEGVAQDGEGSGGTPDATPTTTGGNGTKSRTKHPPGGEVSRQYPRCLRRVCGAGGFLVVHCLQQVVDGAATTYITTCTTHLRRHLQFSHPHLAAILLLRHLGPVLMGVILSQVGGRGHRARWVAAAQLLTALATLATLTTALIPPPTPPLDSREEDGQDGELYCDVKLLAALANEPTVSEASWVTSWRNGSNTSLASYSRPSPSLTHQHSCIHSHTLTVLVWVFASVLSAIMYDNEDQILGTVGMFMCHLAEVFDHIPSIQECLS